MGTKCLKMSIKSMELIQTPILTYKMEEIWVEEEAL